MLSYNPLKMEIQNPSIGITVNNSLLGVSFTNNELEVSNFPTDYATQDTLNNISLTLNDIRTGALADIISKTDTSNTKLSNIQTNTNGLATQTTLSAIETDTGSIDTKLTTTNTNLSNIDTNTSGLATQTTLNSLLTSVETPQMTRYFNDNNLFTIYQRFGNFGSANTYYYEPINWPSGPTFLAMSGGATSFNFGLSSSSTNDTGKDVFIEGWDVNGVKISETLTLDATNSQTKVVSVNTYGGISRFEEADRFGNGDVYVYNQSESVSAGVPTNAYACSVSGNNYINRGFLGSVRVPNGKKIVIHSIQLNKIAGSDNHRIQLFYGAGTYGQMSQVPIQSEWLVDKTYNLQFDHWLPTTQTANAYDYLFLTAYSNSIDANAIIDIQLTFSFI